MQFILVRHAHADWPTWHGPDFERPLTSRGLTDARATGRAIGDAGHRPTLLLASPARRTQQTAQLIAGELQLPDAALSYVDELYNAAASVLEAQLRKAARPGCFIVLVAHNPGVSNLVRLLTSDPEAAPCQPAEWRLLQLP